MIYSEINIVSNHARDTNYFVKRIIIINNCYCPQIKVVVKKDELQHVTNLCKLEIDSMGRIAVGILRLLKLDGSVGQAALDQLSHLGKKNN